MSNTNTVIAFLAPWAKYALPVVTAILGTWFGYHLDRKKDIREIRRGIYTDFLKEIAETQEFDNCFVQSNLKKLRKCIVLIGSKKTIRALKAVPRKFNYQDKHYLAFLNTLRSDLKVGKCKISDLSEVIH